MMRLTCVLLLLVSVEVISNSIDLQPSEVYPPPLRTAAVGSTIEKQWQINGKTTEIIFIKNNDILSRWPKELMANPKQRPQDNLKVTFDEISGILNLRISPVKFENQGKYSTVIEDDENSLSSTFVLHVVNEIRKPTISASSTGVFNGGTSTNILKFKTKPNPVQNISNGCDFILKCIYSGGSANITVAHNDTITKNYNVTLDEKGGILELEFVQVTKSREGSYQVAIENQDSFDHFEFLLKVNNESNDDVQVMITCSTPNRENNTGFRLITTSRNISRPSGLILTTDISMPAGHYTNSGADNTLVYTCIALLIGLVIVIFVALILFVIRRKKREKQNSVEQQEAPEQTKEEQTKEEQTKEEQTKFISDID